MKLVLHSIQIRTQNMDLFDNMIADMVNNKELQLIVFIFGFKINFSLVSITPSYILVSKTMQSPNKREHQHIGINHSSL